MGRHSKKLPGWLLGLIIAIFVFAAALLLFSILGYGDDPVVESVAVLTG